MLINIDTPQLVSRKEIKREVEVALDDDFEVVDQTSEENTSTPIDPVQSDVRNVQVDENDRRERALDNYSPWDAGEVDQQIEQNLRNLEKQVIQQRREEGKRIKEDFSGDEESVNKQEASKGEVGSDKSFGGTATVSFNLPGRKPRRPLRVPAWSCLSGGTVVMRITVDQIGAIIHLEVDEAASTGNSCLYAYARSYAEREKFNRDETKPRKQEGTITYTFIAQ